MSWKKNIPNLITCLNLACGMGGIYAVMQGYVLWGAYFILAAAVLDFLDGFIARLLNAYSELGKQLDSLADMVTFGALPAFIAMAMLQQMEDLTYLPFLAFLIAIQSALRLAKFNIDDRQSERFIGLPTPANAMFFSGLPHLALAMPELGKYLYNPLILCAIILVFSFLLTAELPLLALKFKTFSLQKNLLKYAVLACGVLCIALWGIGGIPFVIIAYLVLSLVDYTSTKNVAKA